MSDTLQPRGLQHTKPPCPSGSLLKLMSTDLVMPSTHLILCHPLLLLSSIFPTITVFSKSQFFASGGQNIGVSASASVLPMNGYSLDINNLRYADDTTLMAESEEKLKSILKVKEESEKVGLKLNTQKTKITASGPIISWQIDEEIVETVTNFVFLGSKTTADGDCSREIKRGLLLGRKVITNLDNILKSRDITFPTTVHLVKAMVFPVVMYGCEIWTIKKAEH